MYGEGNRAPPPGGAPQPFQLEVHGPGRPVMQQSALMPPHPHGQQVTRSGMPNMGFYRQVPQHNVGSNQGQYHYPPVQHNSQHPQLGVQNMYQVSLPRSSRPPPPPLPPSASYGFQSSESLIPPPPPQSGYVLHRGVSQPTPSGHQGFPHVQPLQQPHVISHSESYSLSTSNGSQKAFTSPPPPVPPVCPPSGLPGSDGIELAPAVVTAATESPSVLTSYVGCPDPVKRNGVNANNEPTPTSHNNSSSEKVDCIYHEGETRVLVVNDSLAMDSKSELLRPGTGSSSHVNSSTGGDLCSTSDSDMDMEDDILNLVEDLETNESRKDPNHENLAHTENLDAKEQLHGQSLSPGSFSGLPGEGEISCHLHGKPHSIKSPIKVLQGYASDNSTETPCAHNNVKDVSHAQHAIDESAKMDKVGELNLVSDGVSNNQCTTYEESNPVIMEHSHMQKKATEHGKETETDLKISSTTFLSVNNHAEVAKIDRSDDNLCDEPRHPSQVKGRLKPDDTTSKCGKSGVEDTTASLQLKVDEFGRLAKNVSSDSDSDELHYRRKRGRRGRSRSISPFDRRRRTPPRRRYNRSRSRSRSPLRRRSRSRSPGYRRPAGSISERRRRDQIQTSICFNFRDGRCHRGSSCRFLHHNSDKNGSSNPHSRKRLSEAGHSDKGSNFLERSKGTADEMGSHRDVKDKSHGSPQLNGIKGARADSGGDTNVTDKNYVGWGITVEDHSELDQDDHTVASYLHKLEDIGDTAHAVEASVPKVPQDKSATSLPGNAKYQKSAQTSHPYDANSLPSLVNSSTVLSSKEPLEANHSAAVLQYANLQPQNSNISYESISAQHQRLGTQHLFMACNPRQETMPSSSQSYATMNSRVQPVPFENPSSRVPSSVTGTPFSQATSGHGTPQPHSNFRVMQTALGLPPPFTPGGGPAYNTFSLPNQPPLSNTRPAPLWTALPPPPPRGAMYADNPNANNSTCGNTIHHQFERNQQPQRTDVTPLSISSPYSGHLHFKSQYGGNPHGNYHQSVEGPRPPFAFPINRPDSLFIVNSHPQQTEGLHLERNDLTSIQGLVPSTFQAHPSNSLVGPPATEMLPSSETAFSVSSRSDTILNNTSLNDTRNYKPIDSRISWLCGKSESSSLRTAANLGLSGISEFEDSRTPVHCNNVSTSDRPLASILNQLQMVEVQGVEAHGLREKSSSNISIRNAEHNFPGSGGQQYGLLLDSLDKSSNSLVNSERVKKQRSTSDSDDMLRGIVSRKPLDVEETNRKKESEAIASLTSSDNEEFGETADADVGALENESLSNPVDMPNRDNEVAISETYPDKKSKDSRSMKLFKSAIANFVKEVLKPSWRQGNMSKEAFKTIVKKTVEKVSGAMKGHRYPKSHAKINHYIHSSERKLTKLVMGYVDKYVKV